MLRIVEHNGMVPAVQFRKAESCMLLLKQLSQNSELGQANDPLIKYDDCLQLIREKIDGENGKKELGLAIYELEKSGLIYKHVSVNSPFGWHTIGPREYFFCMTDHIFQNWNPKTDGKSVIRLLLGRNDIAANLEELDKGLGWGPRRLNSALAFLYMNNLIHHNYELGGIKYVLPWARLTEEAHLIEERLTLSEE